MRDYALSDVGVLDWPPPPPEGEGDGFSQEGWATLGSSDLVSSPTGDACRAEQVFGDVLIVNLDSSQSLRVALGPRTSGASIANCFIVGPGCSETLPVYGLRARRISLHGSATATIVAYLATN